MAAFTIGAPVMIKGFSSAAVGKKNTRSARCQQKCSCCSLSASSSQVFSGTQLKATVSASGRTGVAARRFVVEANKKVAKKSQVVLTEDVDKIGKAGELLEVSMGYFRNYLLPQGKAKKASAEILTEIQAKKDAQAAVAADVKNAAQALATGLSTIGKFQIKKKQGEGKSIFGSVTSQDVAEAIFAQTAREVDKKVIEVPEIREVGIYEVQAKLHSEVVAKFNVEVLGVREG